MDLKEYPHSLVSSSAATAPSNTASRAGKGGEEISRPVSVTAMYAESSDSEINGNMIHEIHSAPHAHFAICISTPINARYAIEVLKKCGILEAVSPV